MIAASRIRSEATESAQSKIRNKTFSLHAIPLARLMRIIAKRYKKTTLVIVRANVDLEKLFPTMQEAHKPGF